MLYDFAPMEGITGRLFRLRHYEYFGGADRYFTPFVSPNQHHVFSSKELGDVLPEGNGDVPIVPQILTKNAEDFVWCARELKRMGYREVNLNCGCPSGTVAAKGKGAGMLEDLRKLEAFLDTVFEKVNVAVSVKTRLGLVEDEEFWPVLELFSRYPLAQLIVHPRVQKDFYKNRARRASFEAALAKSKNPVCYNGDLVTAAQCREVEDAYPAVERVMLGRGLVGDPALARKANGGPGADKKELEEFHQLVFEGFSNAFGDAHSAMSRMKEQWFYMIHLFEDSEKHAKAMRKAQNPREYSQRVAEIFRDLELRQDSVGGWITRL